VPSLLSFPMNNLSETKMSLFIFMFPQSCSFESSSHLIYLILSSVKVCTKSNTLNVSCLSLPIPFVALCEIEHVLHHNLSSIIKCDSVNLVPLTRYNSTCLNRISLPIQLFFLSFLYLCQYDNYVCSLVCPIIFTRMSDSTFSFSDMINIHICLSLSCSQAKQSSEEECYVSYECVDA
jgi:hypothetical protein